MKKFFDSFINEEDGIETIEFIGLVAVAAVMIGVIITIANKMSTAADTAQEQLDGQLKDLANIGKSPKTTTGNGN